MTVPSGEDSDEQLLAEVIEKSSVGTVAFMIERVLLSGVAYIVTAGAGAAVYGFLSVLIRGELIARNLVAGLGDGYSRTLPRASRSAQRTIFSVGSVGFATVWGGLALLLVIFREKLIAITLLQPRHESVVLLFALGLLPFLFFRNLRDAFRGLRQIRLAMLVAQIFPPVTLLTGAVVVVAIAGETSLVLLWGLVTLTAVILLFVGGGLLVQYTDLGIGPIWTHRPTVRSFITYTADTTGVATLELVQRRAVFVVMAVYLSPVAAGAFSLAVVIARIVRWPLSGVNGILPPIAAKLYDADRTQRLNRLYKQTSRIATVATTPVFIMGFVYAPDLLALFNEAYLAQTTTLRAVLLAQYVATIFGSVGLLLLMTDNERVSLLTQVFNAGIALPLMVVLTLRFGAVGLGSAYLLSLVINNTTELIVLYYRDGLIPFSRKQFYAVGSAIPGSVLLGSVKVTGGIGLSMLAAGLLIGLYAWRGQQMLLTTADRAAIRRWRAS